MNQDNAAVVETEIAPVETPKAAKKPKAKKAEKKAKAEQVDWNSEALMKAIEKAFPIGSKVEYTGTRVKAHAGRSGIVTGYRNGNGLVVDFGGKYGTGSITKAKAKLLVRGKKGAAAPAEPQAAEQA